LLAFSHFLLRFETPLSVVWHRADADEDAVVVADDAFEERFASQYPDPIGCLTEYVAAQASCRGYTLIYRYPPLVSHPERRFLPLLAFRWW
jgi:hypothetical protein